MGVRLFVAQEDFAQALMILNAEYYGLIIKGINATL